jgi:hypothetical protein
MKQQVMESVNKETKTVDAELQAKIASVKESEHDLRV